MMDEFYNVCTKRMLKINTGKSKVLVFERKEIELVDFNTPYRVSVSTVGTYKVVLSREKMEEVNEFQYFVTTLYKHGEMEGKAGVS